MAGHMLPGTWAKTAEVIGLRLSSHTSLTSLVAHTMGRQFHASAQMPFL